MASAGDIGVSREYMRAQRALENSYERWTRNLSNTIRQRDVNRRPVGAPASAGRPVIHYRGVPDTHLRIAMDLHINTLAAYIRAHSAYYSGNRSVGTSVLRKTLSLSAESQSIGLYQATQDLTKFVESVIIGRCESAVRTYSRSNSSLNLTTLALAVQEAQFLGIENVPACLAAEELLNNNL